MKKLMIVAAMMLMSTGAFAQGMFVKPMVGATLSTLTGDVEDTKFRLGLGAGAEFGYMFSEQFGATAGVLVSMQGCNYKDKDYSEFGYQYQLKDRSETLTYLNIPILANLYLLPGLAVKAGVQPGFLLSAKEKWTVNGHDESESGTEGYKKFAFSIPVGLSYEISDFVIDARYHFGLTNIYDTDLVKVKNGVIMLTVGYKIPF